MIELTDKQVSAVLKEKEYNTLIAHYTTMDGLLGLLNSVDSLNGELMLNMWATSIFALNDPTELMYGYDVLMRKLPEIERELNNVNKDDRLSRIWNIYKTDSQPDSFYHELLKNSLRNQNRTPYVVSFSHEIDNLAMLRMYSNDATGVCLVLSLGKINDVCTLYDVCYDENKGRLTYSPFDMLKSVYRLYLEDLHDSKVEGNAKFKLMLERLATYTMMIAPFVKRGDYAYEKEIRLSELHNISDGIKFRTNKNGNIIPYKEIKIPLNAIKKIIIGPCTEFETAKYAIDLKFKSMNLSTTPEIVKSKNEYRTY